MLQTLWGRRGAFCGLDRDPEGVERARRRVLEQGCSSWVSFQRVNLDEFTTTERFDALVGRYVLLYQEDAAKTVRPLAQFVNPGGIVAFHELDFPDPRSTAPACELWDRAFMLLGEAFSRAGASPHYGRRAATAFTGAGLPFPTISGDVVVGGAPGSSVYLWLANTLVSVASRMESLGLSWPADFPTDAREFAAKLREAVLASASQVIAPTQYGSWTRKPL